MLTNDPMDDLDLSWDRVRRAAMRIGLNADHMNRVVDQRWRELLAQAIEAADRPDLWHEAATRRRAWRDHALARIAEWHQLTEGEGRSA